MQWTFNLTLHFLIIAHYSLKIWIKPRVHSLVPRPSHLFNTEKVGGPGDEAIDS